MSEIMNTTYYQGEVAALQHWQKQPTHTRQINLEDTR